MLVLRQNSSSAVTCLNLQIGSMKMRLYRISARCPLPASRYVLRGAKTMFSLEQGGLFRVVCNIHSEYTTSRLHVDVCSVVLID
jgi:hypothetical protein